jgi:hypothetical protein
MGYIMAAITMMAVLGSVLHTSFNRPAGLIQEENIRSILSEQTYLVRQAALQCRVVYPRADGAGAWQSFPERGVDEFGAPIPFFRNAICPGAPTGAQAIFSAQTGNFLPPPPPGMSDWIYGKDVEGVWIQIDPTTPARDEIVTAIDRVSAQFDPNEITIDDTTGGLRLWLAKNS